MIFLKNTLFDQILSISALNILLKQFTRKNKSHDIYFQLYEFQTELWNAFDAKTLHS